MVEKTKGNPGTDAQPLAGILGGEHLPASAEVQFRFKCCLHSIPAIRKDRHADIPKQSSPMAVGANT